jgi:hypothetical protein
MRGTAGITAGFNFNFSYCQMLGTMDFSRERVSSEIPEPLSEFVSQDL